MYINALLLFGLLLAAAVAVQLCLVAFSFAGRSLNEVRCRRLERKILAEQLEAMRALRRKQEDSALPWHGNRKFRIERKEPVCRDVLSIYLTAHDGKPLPEFLPGQYLTFELDSPDRRQRLVRCYSLSDRPHPNYYRITVKLIRPPADSPSTAPGMVSGIFHEHLKVGDIIDVRAPKGGFHLDPSRASPVVFIAGGIGVTPFMSILQEIVETGSRRETWFFLGVRNGSEHAFKEQIQKFARENDGIRLRVSYSQPRPEDKAGQDYQEAGRVTVDLVRRTLPSNNFDFYLCCPAKMMEELDKDLRAWEVPEKRIHFEAFGAATLRRTASADSPASALAEVSVDFAKSNRKAIWKGGRGECLLDLATATGVVIDSGCRAGNCGTCKVAIKSGQVKYLKPPGYVVEAGTCLACCCVPETALVLDA